MDSDAARQDVAIYLQRFPEKTLGIERKGSEVGSSSSKENNTITLSFRIQESGRIGTHDQSEERVDDNILFCREAQPVLLAAVSFQEGSQ